MDEFIGGLIKTLTLNKIETEEILNNVKWREHGNGGVEILYNDKWLRLCRTDLIDIIKTWIQFSSHSDPNHINFYKNSVAFGARVTDHVFAIVDRYSDG